MHGGRFRNHLAARGRNQSALFVAQFAAIMPGMDSDSSVSSTPIVTESRHFVVLLAFLGMLLIFQPFAETEMVSRGTMLAVFVSVLVASIYTLSRNPRNLLIACILVAPPMIAVWFSHFELPHWFVLGSFLLLLLFCGFVILTILSAVLSARVVTTDIICGAICAYLLFGISFAILYSVLEELNPASFRPPVQASKEGIEHPLTFSHLYEAGVATQPAHEDAASQPGTALQSRVLPEFSYFVYYSFVTLTSVGYGDMIPQRPFARTFSIIEALGGQLYIAVLIARLVAIQVTHVRAREP